MASNEEEDEPSLIVKLKKPKSGSTNELTAGSLVLVALRARPYWPAMITPVTVKEKTFGLSTAAKLQMAHIKTSDYCRTLVDDDGNAKTSFHVSYIGKKIKTWVDESCLMKFSSLDAFFKKMNEDKAKGMKKKHFSTRYIPKDNEKVAHDKSLTVTDRLYRTNKLARLKAIKRYNRWPFKENGKADASMVFTDSIPICSMPENVLRSRGLQVDQLPLEQDGSPGDAQRFRIKHKDNHSNQLLKNLDTMIQEKTSEVFEPNISEAKVVCSNGTLFTNKLLLGLAFPELKTSDIFALPIDQIVMMPQTTIAQVKLTLNKALAVPTAVTDAKTVENQANVGPENEQGNFVPPKDEENIYTKKWKKRCSSCLKEFYSVAKFFHHPCELPEGHDPLACLRCKEPAKNSLYLAKHVRKSEGCTEFYAELRMRSRSPLKRKRTESQGSSRRSTSLLNGDKVPDVGASEIGTAPVNSDTGCPSAKKKKKKKTTTKKSASASEKMREGMTLSHCSVNVVNILNGSDLFKTGEDFPGIDISNIKSDSARFSLKDDTRTSIVKPMGSSLVGGDIPEAEVTYEYEEESDKNDLIFDYSPVCLSSSSKQPDPELDITMNDIKNEDNMPSFSIADLDSAVSNTMPLRSSRHSLSSSMTDDSISKLLEDVEPPMMEGGQAGDKGSHEHQPRALSQDCSGSPGHPDAAMPYGPVSQGDQTSPSHLPRPISNDDHGPSQPIKESTALNSGTHAGNAERKKTRGCNSDFESDEKTHACLDCGSYKTARDFKDHVSNCKGKFYCEPCNESFRFHSLLLKHNATIHATHAQDEEMEQSETTPSQNTSDSQPTSSERIIESLQCCYNNCNRLCGVYGDTEEEALRRLKRHVAASHGDLKDDEYSYNIIYKKDGSDVGEKDTVNGVERIVDSDGKARVSCKGCGVKLLCRAALSLHLQLSKTCKHIQENTETESPIKIKEESVDPAARTINTSHNTAANSFQSIGSVQPGLEANLAAAHNGLDNAVIVSVSGGAPGNRAVDVGQQSQLSTAVPVIKTENESEENLFEGSETMVLEFHKVRCMSKQKLRDFFLESSIRIKIMFIKMEGFSSTVRIKVTLQDGEKIVKDNIRPKGAQPAQIITKSEPE